MLTVDSLRKELDLSERMLNQTILKLRYNLLISAAERGNYIVTPPNRWLALARFLTAFPELEKDFKNIFLDGLWHVKSLFLFGSRAFGTVDKESDYDLLVVVDSPLVREALLEQARNWASRGVNFEVYSTEGIEGILENSPLYLKSVLPDGVEIFDDVRLRHRFAEAKVKKSHLRHELEKVQHLLETEGDVYAQAYIYIHALRTLTSIGLALEGCWDARTFNKKVNGAEFENREEIRRVYRNIANFDEQVATDLEIKDLANLKLLVEKKMRDAKKELK